MNKKSIEHYSESEIIDICLQKNQYEVLFQKYCNLVSHTISKTCKNTLSKQDIEDIQMDVFEDLMKNALKRFNPDFQKTGKKAIGLTGWIILITTRKTMTFMRNRKNFIELPDCFSVYNEDKRQEARNVIQCINENMHIFTPREKLVFKMKYFFGKNRKQIAKALGITLDAVDAAHYRARKKVKENYNN
jgi:RNA polymerase sigma factor (sigma-70 family)